MGIDVTKFGELRKKQNVEIYPDVEAVFVRNRFQEIKPDGNRRMLPEEARIEPTGKTRKVLSKSKNSGYFRNKTCKLSRIVEKGHA